jgi:hypothetical protein
VKATWPRDRRALSVVVEKAYAEVTKGAHGPLIRWMETSDGRRTKGTEWVRKEERSTSISSNYHFDLIAASLPRRNPRADSSTPDRPTHQLSHSPGLQVEKKREKKAKMTSQVMSFRGEEKVVVKVRFLIYRY